MNHGVSKINVAEFLFKDKGKFVRKKDFYITYFAYVIGLKITRINFFHKTSILHFKFRKKIIC